VIGVCTAYYLTRHPDYDRSKHHITILEATKIAGGASGKAGGFIASWADPPCLASLTWGLHTGLAKEYDGVNNYGYREVRRLHCDVNLQGEPKEENTEQARNKTIAPIPDGVDSSRIETCELKGDGAQLHPFQFTTVMANEAKASGVEIIFGSATSINYSEDGTAVKSVNYRSKDSKDVNQLRADYVVVAAGPWTPTVLPKVPITGARNCAIHLRAPSKDISPDLVFFNNEVPNSWFPRIKFYPRPDDTIHISAGTDHLPILPASTDLVVADKEICEHLRRAADFLSPRLQGQELLVEQACYRPALTIPGRDRTHGPLLCPTPISGLVLATGHDNWGIQNAPATGKIVSELVFDGKVVSADISSLAMGVDLRDIV
jgi:glycine/D-amino acid oxidase-like deaminating enzyme